MKTGIVHSAWRMGLGLLLAALCLLPSAAFAAENYIQVPPDSTGKKMRSTNQVINTHTVEQQGILIGDNDNANTAEVMTSAPSGSEAGVVVRTIPSGVHDVTPASPAAGDYLPVRITDGSGFDPTRNVQGTVASDSADAGNPVKTGGIARATAWGTAVAGADRVDSNYDLLGRQITATGCPRGLVARGSATVSTTTETTLIAQVASMFVDLQTLVLTNTSATAVRVDVREATAGSVIFSVALAANGGAVINLPVAVPQTTVNNNWTIQLSAGVTDVRAFGMGCKTQ